MSTRPFIQIQSEISTIIEREYQISTELIWTKPPSEKMGDVSFPLFALAKELKTSPQEIGATIMNKLDKHELIEKIELKGGFMNLFLNKKLFSERVLSEILNCEFYGKSDIKSSDRIIIEHTSSNPNGPLHIGNFRGSVIGDVVARVNRMLGAKVNVRYYVNDLGRQIAPVVIGYFLLKRKEVKVDCKIDLWIGKIYAVMNTLLDIQELKLELLVYLDEEKIKQSQIYVLEEDEILDYKSFLSKIDIEENTFLTLSETMDKLLAVQNKLLEKIPSLYVNLRNLVSEHVENLSQKTVFYVEEYLKGENTQIISEFREVTQQALTGHIETLKQFNISHNDFDRESDVAWSGEVIDILKKLDEKGWLKHDGDARLLKSDQIATSLRFKEKYGITYEIPELILVNSEGIPLYPCRDIAYHLDKLDKFNANACINVIGKQQQALQLGVKIALYGLNKSEIADKIFHFDYEYVTLVGRKMAGRELEYVTPDELIELAKKEVIELLESRDYSKKEKQEIAFKVAKSSVKFSILKIDPQKVVVFDVKKAVDMNENSGAFLQYSFTRALNIVNKALELGFNVESFSNKKISPSFELKTPEEWNLVKSMEELPAIYERAVTSNRPDTIANFAYEFGRLFNKFYDKCPVIVKDQTEIIPVRLFIVQSSIKCFESLFQVMGLDTLDKM